LGIPENRVLRRTFEHKIEEITEQQIIRQLHDEELHILCTQNDQDDKSRRTK
jgi:hypothetical protein